MKNRIIKYLIILIILFGVLYIKMPTVYASMRDNFNVDTGKKPTYVPPDDPIVPITTTPPSSGKPSKTVIHYTAISGNVYEELGESFKKYTAQKGTLVGDISNEHLPIEGVIVQAGGYQTVTNANGDYRLNLPPGNYSLKFIYGKLVGNTYANTEERKRNVLKYNGYDYIVTKAPDRQDYEYTTTKEIEIIGAGKGCEQIMLLVDCSGSVRNSTVEINGEKIPRINAIVESTKKLVDSLLSSGENIYIGLIFFSGECYRAQSLTNNGEILKQHLDYIRDNDWWVTNTNVVGALNKAESSFVFNGKDANRHIIVLSDGVPTSDNKEEDKIYSDDTDADILSKLNGIKSTTRGKIQDLKNKGISIRSIYLDPEDEEESAYIKQIFDDARIMQSDAFISEITDSLKKDLITTTVEKEYKRTATIDRGLEDLTRREEVDDNFNDIFYYNTGARAKLFEQIESEYKYDEEEAMELSNLTYMIAYGGKNYEIHESGGGKIEYDAYIDHYETDYDENGNEIQVPVYGDIIHVDAEYTGRDLGLTARPALDLQLEMAITGERVTASKGMQISAQTRDINSEESKIEPIRVELDDELLFGTVVDVEYSIKIENVSSLACHYLQVITFLPEAFGFDENTKLITGNWTNKAYDWAVINLLEYKNLRIYKWRDI